MEIKFETRKQTGAIAFGGAITEAHISEHVNDALARGNHVVMADDHAKLYSVEKDKTGAFEKPLLVLQDYNHTME